MIFIGISTWSWCYALWSSLAFPHDLDATLYDLHWHFHMILMLRSMIFNCNSTHPHPIVWGGVGWDDNVIGISTWSWCYALWSSLGFPHDLDATLKYGNACALSCGGGSAQGKTWWKPPLTRWRKCEKKLRLPFFRLKSWKGCYSQSRWTFFLERFWMKKIAPRCDEIVIFIIFVRRQRFRVVCAEAFHASQDAWGLQGGPHRQFCGFFWVSWHRGAAGIFLSHVRTPSLHWPWSAASYKIGTCAQNPFFLLSIEFALSMFFHVVMHDADIAWLFKVRVAQAQYSRCHCTILHLSFLNDFTPSMPLHQASPLHFRCNSFALHTLEANNEFVVFQWFQWFQWLTSVDGNRTHHTRSARCGSSLRSSSACQTRSVWSSAPGVEMWHTGVKWVKWWNTAQNTDEIFGNQKPQRHFRYIVVNKSWHERQKAGLYFGAIVAHVACMIYITSAGMSTAVCARWTESKQIKAEFEHVHWNLLESNWICLTFA